MSLRRELVELALAEGANVAGLCRRFGVSRKTAYKWVDRYLVLGVEGLADRSRRPHRFRCRTGKKLEQAVVAVRKEHPAWGGRKIRRRLKALKYEAVPTASTITAILHRENLIEPAESLKRKELKRFERAAPNDLWQMDYKGEFKMGNARWCYPLTLLDDHSRYSLGVRALGDQRGRTAKEALIGVFRQYGLPWAMLMDNGVPWSTGHSLGGWTKLSAWLLRLDIRVIRGRAYHPQTQGKEERFHRTLKAEVRPGEWIRDLAHAQAVFDQWRPSYNFERPHEALEMATPSRRYRISRRAYPERLAPLEYGDGDEVRSVNPAGQFRFRGRGCKTSEAFSGERMGLRPTTWEGVWEVYYGRHRVGYLDLRQTTRGDSGVGMTARRPAGLAPPAPGGRPQGE